MNKKKCPKCGKFLKKSENSGYRWWICSKSHYASKSEELDNSEEKQNER